MYIANFEYKNKVLSEYLQCKYIYLHNEHITWISEISIFSDYQILNAISFHIFKVTSELIT